MRLLHGTLKPSQIHVCVCTLMGFGRTAFGRLNDRTIFALLQTASSLIFISAQKINSKDNKLFTIKVSPKAVDIGFHLAY
jgi:hypothetical protein